MTKGGMGVDAPTVTGQGKRYLPALDGLRALAVSAVIAYHLGLPWARGGFLGVDFFFVVSGFLITGILLREFAEAGRLDLGNFYARRARRLLPALFVVIAAIVAFTAIRPGAPGTAGLRGDVGAALGYVANWRFVLSGQGYFARFTVPSPLRHTWSLAIEEQYYIIWPIVLIGILRITGQSKRWALIIVAALAGASALTMAMLFHPGSDPSRAYYGTDSRAFELLIGSGSAIWLAGRAQPGRWARRLLHVAGAVSLLALGLAFLRVSDSSAWMYRGGFLGVSVLGAIIVASATRDDAGPLGALLSFGPLPWVGRLSYGLYLWHWPVIDLLTREQTGLAGRPLMALQVGVSVAAAVASYYLIERPIRSGVFAGWRAWALAPTTAALLAGTAVLATALPSGAALAQGANPGVPLAAAAAPIVAVRGPAPATAVAGATSGVAVASAAGTPASEVTTTTAPPPGTASLVALVPHRTPTPQNPLRVLIVGDSVMYDASLGIAAALQATGDVRAFPNARLGFGLTVKAYDWRTQWRLLVAQTRPDVVVSMFGGWDASQALAHGDAWYASMVGTALSALQSGGASVVFLGYPQNYPPSIPGQVALDPKANEAGRELVNRVFAEKAAAAPADVAFVSTAPALEINGKFATFMPGRFGQLERVRKHDNVHICPAGAERLGILVDSALSGPLGLPPTNDSWPAGSWRSDARYDNPHGTCRN
jgi:peptidoglycan/LPS O-acetylase OafA/YrhL